MDSIQKAFEPPATVAAPSKLVRLKDDLLASLVVFLVALPLSMGIAIASGVPTERAAAVGLLTGVVGGILVGAASGCPLQVTGPAAGLAVIVAQLIERHGIAMLGPIVLLAGLIQITAAALKFGQWFRAVSPSLVQGMLAGIGILIFASQFHLMVDDAPPGVGRPYGGLINLATIPIAVWKGVTEPVHQEAAAIGIITILAIMLWNGLAPRKLAFIPAPLVGVASATIAAAMMGFGVNLINVPARLLDVVHRPALGDLARIPEVTILMAGLALAFVASAESLLTAAAVDAMQQHAPRTQYDRELAAQGIGNVASGLIGGLPVTGVTVRSCTNVLAGAKTRASTIMHGVWLLVFAMLAPGVLRLIPVASLAAVLVYTGYKLMNFKVIGQLRKHGRGEVAVYAVTLGTVVMIDLLTGVVVGIGVAVGRLFYIFTHLKIDVQRDEARNRTILRPTGAATFVRLPQLAAVLESVAGDTELHVHLEDLRYIDHACFDLLMNWERQHEAKGGRLVIDWDELGAKVSGEAVLPPLDAPRPGREPVSMS